MRYLGLAPVLLFILVGCQDAAPQYPVRTLPAPEGFRGEVRPILGRLSLRYGPHENVAVKFVTTYKETVDGKTETYQETFKLSSSARLAGDILIWEIDGNEAYSPGAKTVQELTDAELQAELDRVFGGVGTEDDAARLPLAQRINPGANVHVKDPGGLPILKLRMLISPKGGLKDISATFPADEAAGRPAPKPGSKKHDELVKELRREAMSWIWEFSETPVGVGDRLYRAARGGFFTASPGFFDKSPEWIVAGLTTYNGRPSILARFTNTLRFRTAKGDIPFSGSGYAVVDLETGLWLTGMMHFAATAGAGYRFVMVGRLSAEI